MKPVLILLFGLTAHLSTSYASDIGLGVSIDSATNFNSDQNDKLQEAKQLLVQVINSADFKNAVLNFSYNDGTKQVNGFYENVGLSGMNNQQVFDYLMTGAEAYPEQTAADHVMNINVNLAHRPWYKGCGVLGFTDVDTKIITMYDCFFNKTDAAGIAMNLAHEWTHKMGFDHDYNATANRDSTVPYAIGYIVRDLAEKISPSASTEIQLH